MTASTISFACQNGHHITVPAALAGKRGKCSRCGVAVLIPALTEASAADAPPPSAVLEMSLSGGAIDSLLGDPIPESTPVAAPIAGVPSSKVAIADLVARLWEERNHGGEVELHLAGATRPIFPQFFEPAWSQGSHAVFARGEPDGTITLEAVAWEAIQRIVVRKVKGKPEGMFS
jgi:hypothetical protein